MGFEMLRHHVAANRHGGIDKFERLDGISRGQQYSLPGLVNLFLKHKIWIN